MAVGSLATAAVDVIANVDKFEPDFRRQMDRAISSISRDTEKQFQKSGDRDGKAYGKAVSNAAKKESGKGGKDAGNGFSRAFETAAARAVGTGLFRVFAAGAASLVTAATPLSTILGGATASLVALTGAIGQAAGASVAFGGVLGALGLGIGTVVLGFQGVGDAMKATGKAQQELATTGKVSAATQQKLDAALKNLAPSARALVKEIVALGPAWHAVQQTVQQNLFNGVGASIKQLAGTYLPILRTQLGASAKSLSLFANSLAKFLSAPAQSNQINNIFSGLNVILPKLLSSVQPLLHGFLQLFQASLPFAVRLAGTMQSLAQRFSDWADAVTKSGSFKTFMQGAFQAASLLLGLLKNIGSILVTTFGAGAAAGAGLLQVLKDITGNFAAFLKTPAGQQALANFFGTIAAAGQVLSNIFATLRPALQGVSALFSAMTPAIQALGTALVPVIAQLSVQLGAALAQLGPVLAQLLAAITPLAVQLGTLLVTAFATLAPLVIQLLSGLTPLVGLIAGALAQGLAAITPLFVQLQPILAQFIAALISGLAPVIAALVPMLPLLVNAVVQIAQAFIVLLPSLLPLIPALAQSSLAMAQLLIALTPLIPVIVQVAQLIAGVLGPALALIIPPVVGVINSFTQLIGVAASVVGAIARLAASVISNFVRIQSAVASSVGGIVSFVASNFGRLTGIVSSILSAVVGLVTGNMGRFVSAIASGTGHAVALFRALPSQFTSALSGLAGSLAAAGRDAIQGLVNGLTSGLGKVRDIAGQIASTVSGAVKNILKIGSPSKLLHQYGVWTGQGFVNGIDQLIPAVQKVATKMATAASAAVQKQVAGITDKTKRAAALKAANSASAAVKQQINDLSAAASRSAAVITKNADAIDARIKVANDNLKNLLQQSAQFAQQVAQSIVRTGDLSQMQDRSFKGIVTSLTTAVTQATQFNKVLAQLKSAGLGPTALQQIANAGPEAGLELGKNILAAGKRGVDQINRLQSQLNRTANATGQTAADALYGAGLKTAQGILAGLKQQRSALDAQMVRLATVLATSLARVLGIKTLPGVKLPKLANGGMTNGPSIAGEAGRELVIPMTKPRRRDELIERYLMNDRGRDAGKTREINMPVVVKGLSKDETLHELRNFLRNTFGPRIGITVAGGTL
jgi:phage-related protein